MEKLLSAVVMAAYQADTPGRIPHMVSLILEAESLGMIIPEEVEDLACKLADLLHKAKGAGAPEAPEAPETTKAPEALEATKAPEALEDPYW